MGIKEQVIAVSEDSFSTIAAVNRLLGQVKCLEDLAGKTILKLDVSYDSLKLWFDVDKYVELCHHQDCCESVTIEDICGDLEDLVGHQIVYAEETVSLDYGDQDDNWGDSETWTFYRFQTTAGSVDIRWYGASNGYYSESVDIDIVEEVNGKVCNIYN